MDEPRTRPTERDRESIPLNRDHSPWNWLLLVPILLVIYPPLYNRTEPDLFNIPFFYWYQLVVIPIAVVTTVLVYRMVRRNGAGR